ncbi:outer membrane protein [Arenimonas composti]|uniref:Outer membrane protein beta-barrel domain-containing protein n=1 Tax=Arenimonas composti TR7-09 = DSM 18010 TaxID=1121013 RepID=A0A091BF94_9GAMM|nr:outer membrane beta-barrel protein [Arenimonas composti]KFN51378.1 hypothetical protein P873_03675 [Arenimonas composti TR7-09 = DSM 18010]
MKPLFALSLTALFAAASTPAAAQWSWDGFHIGIHGGATSQSNDSREMLDFDTDGDGRYGDGVSSDPVLLINAFAPGFCGGTANSGWPQSGCRNNMDDNSGDVGIRIGYDWQTLDLVVGVAIEHSTNEFADSVTGYTTALNTYTMHREVGDVSSIRGRIGFTFGDGSNLAYATLGYGRADVVNRFTTSDNGSTYTLSGEEGTASGWQFGIGYETFVTRNITLGLEWLSSSFDDDSDFTVHADGGIFDHRDPDGTDIRRTRSAVDFSSTRLTLGWRFNDGDW